MLNIQEVIISIVKYKIHKDSYYSVSYNQFILLQDKINYIWNLETTS